ncbi:MAG: ATP-binding cassette domain-containing protein [Candidatus Izemoplasmatales bacterium]|jgi:putative ABC transport system permease protein
MLKLRNISKSYTIGEYHQKALDNVSVDFRKNEFVTVLGPSGCGKTTLLNIIGGLDKYDSGDLEILGKSTKAFHDQEWDMYRNNSIGFIFQNHNLIPHLSVIQNVELGLALSGAALEERHKRAKEVLEQVGLTSHINKKPNQLSGGESQRVAIARALANNPDIILADEPTGSLDSVTSIQILDIIKEISKDRLVIMVSHNQDFANRYSTRIINLKDGKIIGDSHPVTLNEDLQNEFKLKKTAMSLMTALISSINNIRTKLGRTILTAFAGSIGIIGIALVLSLSNGLDEQITAFERDTISGYPITISSLRYNPTSMMTMVEDEMEKYPDYDYATLYVPRTQQASPNTITDEYVEYVTDFAAGDGSQYISGIKYVRFVNMSLLRQTGDTTYTRVYIETNTQTLNPQNILSQSMNGPFLNRLPEGTLLNDGYDLLYGEFPVNDFENGSLEVILVVDDYNRISKTILTNLGFDNIGTEEGEINEFAFSEIVGQEFKLNIGAYDALTFDADAVLNVRISGIVRLKTTYNVGIFYSGLGFTSDAIDYIYANYPDEVSTHVDNIYIYATDFDAKEIIGDYLESYNTMKGYSADSVDRIEFIDWATTFTSIVRRVLDTIEIVLIAFAAVSLVVSSIMIAIITYISVLERTKEIGVLRALGARKKDVSRVFNSENLIIGFIAGIVGIGITYLLVIPVNMIIEYYAEMPNVASLKIFDASILVAISVVLAFMSGFIPARLASKKDPVIALRTE